MFFIQSCCSKLHRTATRLAPKSCFPKAVSQSYFLQLFPKAIVFQSNCPSMLLSKPQSCSPKLLFKIATESRVRKTLPKIPMLLPEAASKLIWKVVQSCSPKLLPKAVPRRCSPKLYPKAVALKLRFCKPVRQNDSPKPFCKAAPKSCAQTCYQKIQKLLSKAIAPKLQLFKPIPPNGSWKLLRKLFCKAAPESCSRKLLLKAASRSCL